MDFKQEMELFVLRENMRRCLDAGPKFPKGSKYRFKEVEPFILAEMNSSINAVRIIYKHIIRALKDGDSAKLKAAENNAIEGFEKLKANVIKFNDKLNRTYNI